MTENPTLSDHLSTSNSSVDSLDSNDSLTSSVFGFTCGICKVRAVSQLTLEEQFQAEQLLLTDLDKEKWVKCDDCGASYHKTCWETYDVYLPIRFLCCK